MEIRIPCSHCGKVLLVQSESAGTVGVCPACHQKINIVRPILGNTPNQIADTLPSAPQAARGSTPTSKSNPSSGSGSHSNVAKRKCSSSQDISDIEFRSPNSIPSSMASRPTAAGGSASIVDPFAEQPDAAWYVRPPGGSQYGPASNEEFKLWIAEGRVGTQSIVWRTGWTDWLPASRVFNNLTDMPGGLASTSVPKASKAAEYIAMRRKRFRVRPIHYVAIGFGLVALLWICSKIFL